MAEIDLLDQYPRSPRTGTTGERARHITDAELAVVRQFGKEYFDGDRMIGYGGYHYHPRFWQATVRRFRDHYGLDATARILDVGCAKGFMLHDFRELLPGLRVAGLDISEYAISNAIDTVKPFLTTGTASDLPFRSHAFDLVTAINTVHNLPLAECKRALREIQRVSRGRTFMTVDAYRTAEERERLERWTLTCQTYMHVDDWKALFAEVGYTGDYHWFILG